MEMLRSARPGVEPAPAVATIEPGSGSWRLRVEGRLPVDCVGSLARGLADAGIDVAGGQARRTDRSRWEIELDVIPGRAAIELAAIDYVALATRRSSPGTGTPVVLDAFSVARDPASRALVASVRGVDRVGFLAGLLERFAGILLFPVEMTVATVRVEGRQAGTAVDRFVLRSLGNRTPPHDAEPMLTGLLERMRG